MLTLAPAERPYSAELLVATRNSCSASMGGDRPGEFIIMKLLSTPSTVRLLSWRRWPFTDMSDVPETSVPRDWLLPWSLEPGVVAAIHRDARHVGGRHHAAARRLLGLQDRRRRLDVHTLGYHAHIQP